MPAELTEQLTDDIKAKITEYQQANFWNCYPSGGVKDWIVQAIAEKIVLPMQTEIDGLKAQLKK